MLFKTVQMSHENRHMMICFYADASDAVWTAEVTHCAHQELRDSVQKQNHDPFPFLSSNSNSSRLPWPTCENETFVFVRTLKNVKDMLTCFNGISLLPGERILFFTFHPTAFEPNPGPHTVQKLIGWVLHLSTIPYSIGNVSV